MAFAGLHTLEEKVQDCWNPFFGSVRKIEVSFLGADAACRLLTRPSPEFPLEYSADALQSILELTNRQPYLMQLIGFTLTSRYNQAVAASPAETSRIFTLSEVQEVITEPEFYRNGDAYFAGVWAQATSGEMDGTPEVLLPLTLRPMTAVDLVRETAHDEVWVNRRLAFLIRRAVLRRKGDEYCFAVPRMRDWVYRNKGGRQQTVDAGNRSR